TIAAQLEILRSTADDIKLPVFSFEQPDEGPTTTPDWDAYRAGTFDFAQHIVKLTEAQQKLNGTTLDTKDGYEEALSIMRELLLEVDEGTGLWFSLADGIHSVENRLEDVNDELGITHFSLSDWARDTLETV